MLLTLAGLAWAHQPGLSYLSVTVHPERLEGRLDVSLRDVEAAIGLDEDNNGSVTYEELLNRQPVLGEYVKDRLKLGDGGKPLSVDITAHKVASDQDGVFAVIEWTAAWERIPRKLEVSVGLFFDIDPNHRSLMQLVFEGEPIVSVFRLGDPTHKFELAKPSKGEQFREFLWEGTWHIWIGYDHILFLIALLLPAVLQRKEADWTGVDRFGPALLNVVKIVTAFTIAHSITLSLAVLGLVTLPSKAVEVVIAGSVAVAAVNNLYPLFRDRTWLVAFGFGIIHGFGFASVLGMLELPYQALALALVSFNLGVELGQLAIVAAFLPLAYALRSTRFYTRGLLQGGSGVIVLLALMWVVQRITGE